MTATANLTDEQTEILRTIRDFVGRDVLPNVARYDHADEFPAPLQIQQLVIVRRLFERHDGRTR